MRLFIVEDETHSEPQGEFPTFDAAFAELRRRAAIPWDRAPNQAPCENWPKCGRRYEVVEYDAKNKPWVEIKRTMVLEIFAAGVTWHGAA